MRTILFPDSVTEQLYEMSDPDALSESELEYKTVRVLSRVFPEFHCVLFAGGFQYDDKVYRPDLALVARNFSHWFVIEVELVSHSFDAHVLPQARAFRYGAPQPDCVNVLARELEISVEQARTLIEHVPRSIAVIANKPERNWEIALRSHDIQFLTVSIFKSPGGIEAIEIGGTLQVLQESLGFGTYSATDRSIRFPRSLRLPSGPIQINDPRGAASLWSVVKSDGFTWVTKELGVPDIPNGSFVQLIRAVGGRLYIRRSE
jgi:hypothetical protein